MRGGPAAGTDSGLYVLALSWTPDFCCKNPDREECGDLGGSYGGSHFTLHGLWPTYDDRESAAHGYAWPEFCGDCSQCKHPSPSCRPDPATLPDAMRQYGPGYVTDHHFLAGHEWPRHGACTGLSPAGYFLSALGAMLRLPGAGTPGVVSDNAGGAVRLRDLEAAFAPAGTVLLGCDEACNLTQVGLLPSAATRAARPRGRWHARGAPPAREVTTTGASSSAVRPCTSGGRREPAGERGGPAAAWPPQPAVTVASPWRSRAPSPVLASPAVAEQNDQGGAGQPSAPRRRDPNDGTTRSRRGLRPCLRGG